MAAPFKTLLRLPVPQANLREASFLYSYANARANKLLGLPNQLWDGPFPAQIAFDVLFDLCLVADEALHYKNPDEKYFIDHATLLSQRTELGLSREDLGAINGMFQNDFARTLQSALADQLTLPDGRVLSPLACSLAVAYGCRNRGAHTVAAVPLVNQQFDFIVNRINDILFLTVATLYRDVE